MEKVVIVTGGADGIGKQIIVEFLKIGYIAVAFDINDEKIEQCLNEFADSNFYAFKCDVTSEDSVKKCIGEVVERYGRIDVLVNNAGGSLAISQPVDEINVNDWDKVITLNLRSTFLCTKYAVSIMKSQKYGRIINMSSMAGRSRSVFGGAPYAAAKAGIIGFTRQVSKDLGPMGITINAIAPGTVISGDRISTYWDKKSAEDKKRFFDSNPSGRLGLPIDVARVVIFLSDADSSFINGAVFDVNGGMWVG